MKDSKNIYEFLNEMVVDMDDYEKEDLSDMEKQNLKNNFRKKPGPKYNFKKMVTIAAALALSIGAFSQTSFGQEVYAATESRISTISYSIGKALGIEKDIEPYANVVNKTVEDKGVEVKLTDVIIDRDELLFSTIVNINKDVDGYRFNHDIFINGKKLKEYGMTGESGPIDNSGSIFSGTYSFNIKGINTEENLDIRIALNDLAYHTGGTGDKVKGKWEFEFSANGKELMASTNVLPIDYSFNIEDQKYSLEEFRLNPINQKIFGKVKGEVGDAYQIQLSGYDNLGNEVEFFLNSKSGEDLVFKYENIHGNLADEITSITLTPYAAKFPEQSGRMSQDYKQVGEEFTISLE